MQISVDFSRTVGPIKPVHGVGEPPYYGSSLSLLPYLKQAGIPYARLHDIGMSGYSRKWVDIHHIFPDFSADPTDPASYDFTFTDCLINALVENGVEPFFRLGTSIENDAAIKAYHIFPPTDYEKWAVVCEHIIRHYTEGWADGFHHPITYWEIWNEPDNEEDPALNQMWRGNKEQYYRLYDVASRHLKARFPHLKIGGYGSCGFYALLQSEVEGTAASLRTAYFIEFLDGFLDYIREHGCPLDFFSWHSYDSIPHNRIYADYARRRLDEAGYSATELICDEWNNEFRRRSTYEHAALTCGMLLMFQNAPVDVATFYEANVSASPYSGLFDPCSYLPYPAYYAFAAFSRLYALGKQATLTCDDEEVCAVAATDGQSGCVLIANPTNQPLPLEFSHSGRIQACYITGDGQTEAPIALPTVLPPYSFLSVLLCVE